MSYFINEALDDAKKHLDFVKAVLKKYPDAFNSELPDGKRAWFSDSAADDVTSFRVVVAKSSVSSHMTVYLCPCVEIAGGEVFHERWPCSIDAVLTDRACGSIKSAVHDAILDAIRRPK